LYLVRSHCQISGLGCAQSILPWQIVLFRHWCPLQPRTYVRVDSWPSLAWKLNTETVYGKLFKTETPIQPNIAELCASFQAHPSH
jgi:hypothetical protein